jgi:hypothetical protein
MTRKKKDPEAFGEDEDKTSTYVPELVKDAQERDRLQTENQIKDAITKEQADLIRHFALLGPIYTVNEARVNFLGWGPHPDPEIGNSYLNLSTEDETFKE